MLSPRLEAFFRALDAEVQFDGIRPSLDLIGAAAIELVVGHPRGTNDCDILEAWGHNEHVRSELEACSASTFALWLPAMWRSAS